MVLQPGKGFFGIASEDTLAFLAEALREVTEAYEEGGGDAGHDEEPKNILKALLSTDGWTAENDRFGKKAFKSIPVGEGAYRVTLVLTAKGELKIDIRNWFDPNA